MEAAGGVHRNSKRSPFVQVSQRGIHLVRASQPLTLTGLEISSAGSEGIQTKGNSPAQVSDSHFTGNADSGFVKTGWSVQLSNSEFVDNGLGSADGANLLLDCTVGCIADNQFSGGVRVRIVDSDNLLIEGNALRRHRIGLLSSNSRPRIENNQLTDNEVAMQTKGSFVPVQISLNAVQNSERLLDNQAFSEINAANNWWDLEDEMSIGQRMGGTVEWHPFLNVDPALPLDFALKQNYPNPFNEITTIEYTIGFSDL